MAMAMADRLGALRRQGYGTCTPTRGYGEYTPVEARPTLWDVEGGHNEINRVLMGVDEITRNITIVAQQVETIQRNHGVILASFTNKVAKEENEQLMEEVKTHSRKIHNELKKMKLDIEEGERGPNCNTADFRIHKAQYNALSRRFRDVMEEYNHVQEDYREKNKSRMKRQLKYTGKEVTDEQLEEMIESGDTNVFTQDILIETAQKRQALGEVEARHMEIILLETNIRELHDMFYDMALLVDEQGELLDTIEKNVERAAVYTALGKRSIMTARKYRSSTRRKKLVICCLVSGCCLVVLVVTFIAVGVAIYIMDS